MRDVAATWVAEEETLARGFRVLDHLPRLQPSG
jgi:hypothetical protein